MEPHSQGTTQAVRVHFESAGKLLGCLERDCCFTSAFHYWGGEAGGDLDGAGPEYPGGAVCYVQVALGSKTPQYPYAWLSLRNLAVRQNSESRLVGQKTGRKYL